MDENDNSAILGHIFHIGEERVGFLGLGRTVQVIENGEVVKEATVYPPTLRKMMQHNKAEGILADSQEAYAALRTLGLLEEESILIQMDNNIVARTNDDLPERFQRPHPSA